MNEIQEIAFEAPGRGGFVPEKLLGRTGDDFESTAYTTMGLEEVCLENIVMAQLNQDILRRNFEILINALKMHAQKLMGVSRRFGTMDDLIAEIKESLFQNDKKIEDLKEKGLIGGNNADTGADKELFLDEIHKLRVIRTFSINCSIFYIYFSFFHEEFFA